ncbi:efflux RND transporter permease subunit [Azovibrio restrictus]|uniref:efflux RND transporter permease subunit n=1 Tax=Azovibrio restrictus TaxID=146938 RepID=UPI000416867C|nr:efflux RND transporter permease subunit [Azovibrio restrictus]
MKYHPGRYNLSAWALHHPSMVLYLMVVLMLAGALSYFKLGRAEDPDFTIKVMVVRTLWPGASAREVEQQVTEAIEKKLQETPWVHVLRSYSKPGESMVFVELKDYTPKAAVPDSWYQVRKKLGDMAGNLPQGVLGPFANDEFGDTMVSIYALTGDGFDLAALRREADRLAKVLYQVPDVKKVELIGVQGEKIHIDFSRAKLANLGISVQAVADVLARQNAMTAAGYFETAQDRVRLRVPGNFQSPEAIEAIALVVEGRSFRLGDVARVQRGLADPPEPRMYYNGREAIGLGIVMARGGDVIRLGEHLSAAVAGFQAQLPLGLDIHQVANQPEIVASSLQLFMQSLGEAVAIVLAVSFLSLGLRTGAVVALSIPLVLAVTFLFMAVFGIDLQRISLGALIIALGLLVDDAIIAVEMMVVKMEQGWDRFKAATFAYTSTAFPMLTGTLITAAGFMPVGFARSAAGEYTFSIFAVVTIALLVSWVVAVVFTPYLGSRLLNPEKLRARASRHSEEDIYDTPFYRRFRALVTWCVVHRWRVIAATLVVFVLSMGVFATAVQKQFFPASSRPELLVDLWLPEGASLRATSQEASRVEALLRQAGGEDVKFFLSYVGIGSPRFYLPLDQQLFNDNFAQFVITTGGLEARERLKQKLEAAFADAAWSGVRLRVLRLENGPPVGYPVQFRVMGEDPAQLRDMAARVAELMRAHPHLHNVNFSWNEMAKGVRLEVDHDRARALGISAQELSSFLQFLLQGRTVTQLREGDRLVDVVMRAAPGEAGSLDELQDLDIHLADGRSIPLVQVVKLVPVLEDALIWRRNRLPVLTVRADVRDQGRASRQPAEITGDLLPGIRSLEANLPAGYRIEVGGSVEESAKGESSIKAVMPVMLLAVITLLMIQLQSMGRTVMVLLTAPLGLIGVALALLLFNAPYGFVANLGVIALFGMIMRNSVILVDQIERDEQAGKPAWEAIVGAAVRRCRPIMLTAAAAILAMLPLTRQVFWGPMAVAIMGGLLVATVLTLLFLPALYAAWYKVPGPGAATEAAAL